MDTQHTAFVAGESFLCGGENVSDEDLKGVLISQTENPRRPTQNHVRSFRSSATCCKLSNEGKSSTRRENLTLLTDSF